MEEDPDTCMKVHAASFHMFYGTEILLQSMGLVILKKCFWCFHKNLNIPLCMDSDW